ncbi:LacI family DNA-binding transcriptional regulator [Microbacterium sp. I2]|uniref:LacI family DNA-binding transcriptional regulator n=1 Tax=Microbacterium sp. I2 TaxID=3391826 RepID=UPI003ED93B23
MTTDAARDTVRRAATRSDVARLAGVSTAVVSYVMNDGPRPVAAATKEKVLAAMKELDYRPNAVARALRLRRAQAVGLVVPDVSNTYFGALARELSDRAFTAGYALLLGDSDNDIVRERAQIESLVSHQIDGLIVVSLEPDSDADVEGTPIVYLDQRSQPGQRSVIVDNEGGARAAVEHLIGHGRRRIAHLGGLSGAPGADERRQGWEAALTEAGLPADDSLLAHSDYSRSAGREAALGLLSTEELPDAVFVASDAQALGLLAAARERGLHVPDDLALVSFDGTDDAVFSDPPLTAVEQPIHDIAKTALRAVLQPEAGPLHERVGVRLVIRESCGPHNA